LIVEEMGLSLEAVPGLASGALLHDVGKIGVPDAILRKPGPLTEEEAALMRSHTEIGSRMLSQVAFLRDAIPVIRHHHERYDGTGYPDGLQGEDIPMAARIFGLADTFDAMTSDRPYRRALSLDAALDELKKGAGTQFDADVVGCLVRLHRQGRFDLLPSPSSEDLLLLRIKPLRARSS
jgi:HD-GYP domain-containing protein (c-di-GMP phosphodiesterase class II)